MGIVTCPHGLVIALQCDLCAQEAAHGRPRLLVSTIDVPSTELHRGAVRPTPMTIAVLKRALDLSPNIFSDPHGSKPVNDARAWLESFS